MFSFYLVARMEDTRLPKCAMVGELTWWGARALWGGGMEWMDRVDGVGWNVSWTTSELSVSTPASERLQPRTRGKGAKTAEQGAELFMAKWIAAEKVRAGLRHAVLVLYARTWREGLRREQTAQSKRARVDSLVVVDQPQVAGANFCILRAVFFCCLPISGFLPLALRLFFKKHMNAPKPSEHPSDEVKMSKRLFSCVET